MISELSSRGISAAARKLQVAQISCGTEWSGIQEEIDRSAQAVDAEIFLPVADIEDVELGMEKLGFSPASHALRVMLGQAVALDYYDNVDGILMLSCFRCAEGSLTRTVLRKYLEKRYRIPIISYSFTERTKAENLLLRMEALGSLIRHRELLKTTSHKGISLGVDSGSSWTKCVLMEEGQVIGFGALPTTDIVDSAVRVSEKVVHDSKAGFSLGRDTVGVTGYGRGILREKFKARVAMDEITVCAKGATYLSDHQRGDATIIDIGGNDNKAITTHDGVPTSFTVGGVCAGASGRFLEVVAGRLGVGINELGNLALKGRPQNVQMNAYCIVFGMQDLSAGLAAGSSREDTAAAACHSVAEQFFDQQLQEIEVRSPILGIGGTSLNHGLIKALEDITGRPIVVPRYSHFAGAVGAAVLASAAG